MNLSFHPTYHFRPLSAAGALLSLANAVARDPEVFEAQRMDGVVAADVDLRGFEARAGYLALAVDVGGAAVGYILFLEKCAGVYEQHTAFLGAFRGEKGMQFAGWALERLFLTTPCWKGFTVCPDWNRPAHTLAKVMGASEEFRQEGVAIRDQKARDATIFSLTVTEWAKAHHGDFISFGWLLLGSWTCGMAEVSASTRGYMGLAALMALCDARKASCVYDAFRAVSDAPAARFLPLGESGLVQFGNSMIEYNTQTVLKTWEERPCQP